MPLTTDTFHIHDFVDILLVAAMIYALLSLMRGTVAVQVLKGLAILGLVIWAADFFRLETLSWIVERLAPVVMIGVIVLFQPELRRGLARIGERSFGKFSTLEGERIIEEVVRAADVLAGKKTGALVVFERESGLEPFIETGTLLNAEVTTELMLTIFHPRTALHDGAIILRGNTIVAAGCILPLAFEETYRHGTRHRAAIGLSRETDAVVVVVSEETGSVSLAVGGKIVQGIDSRTLQEMLSLYVGGAGAGRAAK